LTEKVLPPEDKHSDFSVISWQQEILPGQISVSSGMKKASKDHLLVLGGYSNPIAVNIHPYFIVFRFDSDFYLYFISGVLYGVFEETNTDLFCPGLKMIKT